MPAVPRLSARLFLSAPISQVFFPNSSIHVSSPVYPHDWMMFSSPSLVFVVESFSFIEGVRYAGFLTDFSSDFARPVI